MYIIKDLIKYKTIIKQFTLRELSIKYKGSVLGFSWTFITPILMLVVYTFVFSEIFNSRWSQTDNGGHVEFALLVFCGLIVFNIFSEVILRAPTLIPSNVNLVKKVVFPLQLLIINILFATLVQAAISFTILVTGVWIFMGGVHWTIVLLPVVILPLVLITAGVGWIVSSLGVYFKDIGQFLGVFVQALMLLSPIFYPVSLIPKNLLFIYNLNPITFVVEDVRRIIVWGQLPQWEWTISGIVIGTILLIIGYKWFMKTKGGFSDVL
ncbi:ABC transporter permease [Paenibacillus filicis]|uniref:Transport permease protein n=1 Tax=Paenibacillus filicis TaxID=669464 RepID=A0ABU9DSN9_9BACL